jgi:hypothetical protein
MKKLVYLLIAVSLVLALVPTVALAHTAGDPFVADLLAGQTEDVGDVKVWNDGTNLYVQFVYEGPDCGFLEVHLQVDKGAFFSEDILTKKGNPIPGHFEKSYKPGGCFTDHTFEYDLAVEGFAPGDNLLIAAHAALGREEAMTIVSGDGQTIVTQRRSGDVVGFTEVNQPAELAWEPGPSYPNDGPDDSAWEAWSLWDRRLSIDLVPTGADWIWESYRVLDPIYGTVLTFERTFDIGYPIDGNLLIACDNGYEVFLNGTSLGSDNVYGDWRTSNLMQAFVDVDGWDAVGSYPLLDYLLEGANTLTIDAANEYFDPPDKSNSAPGTQSSNPGACIFAMDLSYYADGETAWGAGTRFTEDKNWATYFTYTVQESKIVIAGWDTGRGGNYSLNSADSTQARNDLQAKYSDLEVRALNELTAANLADVAVVVLSSVKGNSGAITPWLSEAEQDALYDFVLGGGCAILFPDNSTFAGGNSDPANESLIDPFGLDIMGTLGGGYNANVTSALSPVTSGVASYSGNYAGWFDGTNGATVLATITVSGQNQTSLVEFAPGHFGTGSGRVVVFSDANVFFGGGAGKYSSNTQLFLNSVDACFQP